METQHDEQTVDAPNEVEAHIDAPKEITSHIDAPGPDKNKGPKRNCLHFLKGTCVFGDKCDMMHNKDAKVPSCKYFLQGTCQYGEKCLYRHEPQCQHNRAAHRSAVNGPRWINRQKKPIVKE